MATEPGAWRARTNPIWGDDWPQVRDLWRLDPAVAHCNHGSYGAVPEPVLDAQRAWQDRMHANPVSFFRRELMPRLDATREEMSALVGADPDGFAFVLNATAGVSAVLGSFPLETGDEVLVTDHGYGAVTYAVQRACARSGARMITAKVPLNAGDGEMLACVLDAAGTRTRLAVIDQIASPTARLFPVREIVAALRERGVAVLVDGAHAPGMLAVDLESLGADFWTGNFHKWACAPRGSAGLYVGRRWRAAVRSPVVSWNEPLGYPYAFNQLGTADISAWLATPAAYDVLGKLGWNRLRAHNTELVAAAHHELAAALGLDPAALPADAGVAMRVLPLPDGLGGDDAAAYQVQEAIADRLGVEVAVSPWRGQGLLRISAQAYNAPADYQRLADGLPAVA